MSKAVCKEREKHINNTRFMGELWKTGCIETATICKCIHKLLSKADDVSTECFCALIKTVGEEHEENNNLTECFSIMEEMSTPRNGLSRELKQNLQDLIKFRRQKRIRRKYQAKYP
jgi:hypothetical protein